MWYRVVTESTVSHAAAVWGASLNETEKKILQTIQRPFLLRIARAYRTTPTSALQVLTGCPPLHLTVQKKARESRLLRLNLPVDIHELNHLNISKPAPVQHLHPADREFDFKGVLKSKNALEIYTDGSKKDQGVGAAFIALREGSTIKTQAISLNEQSTVFQAELSAIKAGLVWLESNLDLSPATIFSDSQASIKAILKFEQKYDLVQQIQLLMVQISRKRKIRLNWVKGHADSIGNNKADELAKSAAEKNSVDVVLPLPPVYVKGRLRECLLGEWQSTWDTVETGRTTYLYFPKVSHKRLISNAALTAFLTGHGPFPAYLSRFRLTLSENPNCICGGQGTSEHYLFDCSLTKEWHFKRPSKGLEGPWANQINSNKNLLKKINALFGWMMENSNDIQAP